MMTSNSEEINPLTGSTMDSFLKEEGIEVFPEGSTLETANEIVITETLTKEQIDSKFPGIVEEVKKEESSIEDLAAKAFSELMPIWKRLRKSMNYGSFARVTNSIIEFPLADEYPKFKNEQELNAFKIGCTIMDAKNIMISSTFNKRFKQKQEGEAIVSPKQGEDSVK